MTAFLLTVFATLTHADPLATLLGGGVFSAFGLVIRQLFKRIEKLEQRMEQTEATIRAEIRNSGRLGLVLERACMAYESLRHQLLSLVRHVRSGAPVPAEMLDELEKAPPISEVLDIDASGREVVARQD